MDTYVKRDISVSDTLVIPSVRRKLPSQMNPTTVLDQQHIREWELASQLKCLLDFLVDWSIAWLPAYL